MSSTPCITETLDRFHAQFLATGKYRAGLLLQTSYMTTMARSSDDVLLLVAENVVLFDVPHLGFMGRNILEGVGQLFSRPWI